MKQEPEWSKNQRLSGINRWSFELPPPMLTLPILGVGYWRKVWNSGKKLLIVALAIRMRRSHIWLTCWQLAALPASDAICFGEKMCIINSWGLLWMISSKAKLEGIDHNPLWVEHHTVQWKLPTWPRLCNAVSLWGWRASLHRACHRWSGWPPTRVSVECFNDEYYHGY